MTFLDRIKYAPFFLLSLIPLRILYLFSDFLYFLMYYLVKYRRDVVRANLQLAFPELDPGELNKIEKKFFHHFCDLISESIKFISIKPDNLVRRMKILNPEIVNDQLRENKSFIFYSGHLGNWEWFAVMALNFNLKIVAFYLPLKNGYFNHLVKSSRERFGLEMVEARKGYKALLNYSVANINTITLFLADQSPHHGTVKHWTRFFNQDTPFNIGINAMALKMKQVVLFPHVRQIARGYYEIELIQIWDGSISLKENEIIEIFATKLEAAIRESPHLWLWTHRRWKLRKNAL